MRVVFGYAGILHGEVYEYIEKRARDLAGDKRNFVGCSIPKPTSPLGKVEGDFFLGKFTGILESSNKQDVAFVIIYVRTQKNVNQFEQRIFPTALLHPIDWELKGRNKAERQESMKNLYKLLLKASKQARYAIKIIHHEVNARRNKTPVLLPLRNFKSENLSQTLWDLQKIVVNSPNEKELRQAVKGFEQNCFLKQSKYKKSSSACFSSKKKIEFHAPGNALHGYSRPSDDHPNKCYLSGHIRLGAPYNPSFHYDCISHRCKALKGEFYSCHGENTENKQGDPHLNIAPNDFIRP